MKKVSDFLNSIEYGRYKVENITYQDLKKIQSMIYRLKDDKGKLKATLKERYNISDKALEFFDNWETKNIKAKRKNIKRCKSCNKDITKQCYDHEYCYKCYQIYKFVDRNDILN